MGLAGPKRKQRLVGAATTRNDAWMGDATLPGQRLLAQMGWQEGQGLGSSSQGRSEAIKAMWKMDNKGIGSQRAEKEARELGLPGPGLDRWIGGGGELGGLFERLNASSSSSPTPEMLAIENAPAESSKSKSKSKSKDKDRKRKRSSESAEEEANASSSSSSSKAKRLKKEGIKKLSKEERKAAKELEKQAKKAAKRAEKELKKAQKSSKVGEDSGKEVAGNVPDIAAASSSSVVRNASRAKFLRAKRQLHGDLVSMNEILGISASASPSPAPPAIVRPPSPSPEEVLPTPVAAAESEEHIKLAKEQAKADKKAAKKAAKAAKIAEAQKESSISEPAVPSEKPLAVNTVSPLSVHEYLSRRLMLRKAAVLKARKADQDAIWHRLNAPSVPAGGVGVMVE